MASTGGATAGRVRPGSAPAPPAPKRPPLRLFEPAPRHRTRQSRRHSTWLAGALVVGSLLAVVAGDDLVAQGQITMAAVDQQTAVAQARQQQLRISVSELSAPPVVVSEARQQGMAPATQVVDLPPVSLKTPLPVPHTGLPVAPASATATSAPSAAGKHVRASAP